MEKQIEKILKSKVQNLIASDLISPFFWNDFSKEITALYKDWYPKEFVEFSASCYYEDKHYIYDGVTYTLFALYQYWQDNINDK